jgi:hypothetical protein
MATKLGNALRAGTCIETAAAIAGISKVTLYQWLRLGDSDSDSEEGQGDTLAAGNDPWISAKVTDHNSNSFHLGDSPRARS